VDSASFPERVAGIATLAEPVRRALYGFVAAQPEAVSREQAATGVGVPLHTAKFHLDRLVDDGLLTVEFRRLSGRGGPGAGRPAKLYRRADVEVAVSLPERRYDLAGRLMARAIELTAREGTFVLDALRAASAAFGAALGARVRAAAGDADEAALRAATCRELAEHGYEPQVECGAIVLRNCPFHALARDHTSLVCGMNLALLTAATQEVGGGLTARLDPAENRCCVVVD
jgi:predicted ArsR family transcriptional regulator